MESDGTASGRPFRKVTTRATVVHALAEREAELLGQESSAGHVLVALIWDGHGVAARALADAGLAKGSEEGVRQALRAGGETVAGQSVHRIFRQASAIAQRLDHHWVGTEHVLLAVIEDDMLSEQTLSKATRQTAQVRVHDMLGAPARPARFPEHAKDGTAAVERFAALWSEKSGRWALLASSQPDANNVGRFRIVERDDENIMLVTEVPSELYDEVVRRMNDADVPVLRPAH